MKHRDRELEIMSFKHRIDKFRESLIPGMTLRVYPSTDSMEFDKKSRPAKVKRVYKHFVHLVDDKGFNYCPTYAKLLIDWGNI